MATRSQIKAFYDERIRLRQQETWRPYEAYPVFLDHLQVESGRKLLDVGCGTGFLLKAAETWGLITYGVDISTEAVKIAKKASPKSAIQVGDAENLCFRDNFFHYVICLGSLEHFLNMNKAVREMVRVAKDEAKFCIVVPNINYLDWKIAKWRGRSVGTFQQKIHENLLTLQKWMGLFAKNGLIIKEVHHDRWPVKQLQQRITSLFYTNLLDLPKLMNLLTQRAKWLILPLRMTYQFVFILEKSISQ
jgi:ubiquinone/menaquinone biosynthesis C-methylase UbiE